MAFNEWLKYKETGKKQHLKNAYAIGASTAGGLGGVAAGAAAGAFLGGPFAPLTGLVGGIIGGAKGAEQAEIVVEHYIMLTMKIWIFQTHSNWKH